MSANLENALTRALDGLADWAERRQQEKAELSQPGYFDEEDEEWVDLGRAVKSLQNDLMDWQQDRTKADEAHRQSINMLLCNYQALAAEVDALKQREPGSPDNVRALVRDAIAHLQVQINTLSGQVQELQGQLTQAEQRNRGWQRVIDMTLGRRPRG